MAFSGDPDSQYEIGVCFRNGKHTVQNFERAYRWWRWPKLLLTLHRFCLSYSQGYVPAYAALGDFYFYGFDVLQINLQHAAHFWRLGYRKGMAKFSANLMELLRWYRIYMLISRSLWKTFLFALWNAFWWSSFTRASICNFDDRMLQIETKVAN